MKSLTLLQKMCNDVARHYPEHSTSLNRDFKTIRRRYQNEGFSFVSKTLPVLGDAIFAALETGFFHCPFGFAKTGALPRLFGGLLKVMFDSDTGRLKDNFDVGVLHELRQLCYLYKKAIACTRDERTLDAQAKANFEACDSDLLVDDHFDADLEAISRILWRPISFQDIDGLSPRNGPGGVAEAVISNQKYQKVLDHFDLDLASKYSWSFFELHGSDTKDTRFRATERVSKLHSVPKSSTSRRTITIEPLLLMYHQQAWNTLIRDKITSDPFLSGALSLDDQMPSRQMALAASRSRAFATVDLSSASDRLSLALVCKVFKHDRLLLDGLLASRSSWCDTGNASLKLLKYAGMGNATTFPVQSLVFTILCVKSILTSIGKPINVRNCREALSCVRVYGDDLIIPTHAYSALCQNLQSHGLRVNTSKSFVLSSFRESCGLDAYAGVEITPTYARMKVDNLKDPSTIASLVSTANQLWAKGYYCAATYLSEQVEASIGRLPLVRSVSSGLGWTCRQDAYDVQRWNSKLFAYEVRTKCLRERKRLDRIDGYAALLKFFTELTDSVRDFKQSVVRFQTKLNVRWIPA